MNLVFRAAESGDVASILRLVNLAFRGEQEGWTNEAELLEGERIDKTGILAMVESPGSRVELAFLDDALVGCVNLCYHGPCCHLGMLSVDPSRQAAGLGKSLLAHVESLARGWGCSRMEMTVIHLRTELIDYYQRRGYALTGEWEPFPEGFGKLKVPEIRLLRMARALCYSGS